MADKIKQKMIGTLAWTSVDRFGQQMVQFIVSVILARLLSPNEYTLIALVMIFVTLSNTLVESGFGFALLRKQNANETDFNSVFYFNIFVSILLYVVLYFLTPLIAEFYHLPELVKIARIVFIAIFINAFYLVPNVLLLRELNIKKTAIINILAVFLSGLTGVVLALSKNGVWALVFQQITFPFFRVIIISFYVNWKPKLIFSLKVIKEFFGYSVNLLGTSLLNNIFSYIYVLVLGRFFPKQEVGFYYQANKLNEATNFSFQVILGSTYNVFVKIQEDTDRFRRIFRELVRKSSIVILPLLFMLIAIANPLINVLLTSKWSMSIPYFQLLCIASLSNPLYALIISALNARGKSKTTFNIEIVKKALIIASVVICIQFGIIELLVGFAIANWISTIISVFAIKKEIQHFWKHQLSDILPSLFIGLIIAIASLSLMQIIHIKLLLLILQILISAIIYVISVRYIYPALYKSVINQITSKIALWKEKR